MISHCGQILDHGTIPLNLEPQKKTIVTVPFKKPVIREGVEYRLLMSFHQKEITLWADPGFEIAWDQIDLPWFKPVQSVVKSPEYSLTFREDKGKAVIEGKGFAYIFDKPNGTLVSMQLKGKELIKRGAELNAWRAPLANETDECGFWSSNTRHITDGYGRMAATEWSLPDWTNCRKSGYKTGVYKSTVADMYEPYLIPQNYGLRTDNRWVRMTDDQGTGLEFRGDKLFNFRAQPYSTGNLTKALYTYQLHPFDGITFNFDYATSGVGCTALSVFTAYQVMPQKYDFTVTIRPIISGKDD
jgi:hypothetical protein